MPIEIRELIIKTTVNGNSAQNSSTSNQNSNLQARREEKILAKVSELLRKRKER